MLVTAPPVRPAQGMCRVGVLAGQGQGEHPEQGEEFMRADGRHGQLVGGFGGGALPLAEGPDGEEGVGEQAHQAPAVPGGPAGDLAGVEVGQALGALEVLLDAPAAADSADQHRYRLRLGFVRDGVEHCAPGMRIAAIRLSRPAAVVPRPDRGLALYFRDNDAPTGPAWQGPFNFADDLGHVDAASLIQSSFSKRGGGPGNLEVVARVGNRLAALWRNDLDPPTDGVPRDGVADQR